MMFKFRQTKFLLLVKNINHKADKIATFNPTISYFKKYFMPFHFFQWCPRDWRSLLWWWNQSKFGIRSKYDAYYLLQKRGLCPQQRFQFSGKTMSYRQRYWNLNNYFDFHVCLSFHPCIRPSVRPSVRACVRRIAQIPAVLSQNVTNKSCLVSVMSEKYASWVTLRSQWDRYRQG